MSSAEEFSILVVDDESLVRSMAARALESAGYRVLGAGDGAEALELLDGGTGGIDLVLTDLRMPRVGGVELARQMAERHRNIPVLYMSGDPFAWLAESDLAPVRCLPKPFSPEMLVELVDGIFQSRA